MNEMRKLINLTENVYADEASKYIDGLAEVMANYLMSVSDDPYIFSDISEFSGGALEVRVTELIQAKRKGPDTAKELDEDFIESDYRKLHKDGFRMGFFTGRSHDENDLRDWEEIYNELKRQLGR